MTATRHLAAILAADVVGLLAPDRGEHERSPSLQGR
jgi:hypothetical protein